MLPKEHRIIVKLLGFFIIHSQNFYHSLSPNKTYKIDENHLPQCVNFDNYYVRPIIYGGIHQLALILQMIHEGGNNAFF